MLPAEPWGWRLKRVREKHLDWTIAEVIERLERYMVTSSGAISRLEALDECPADRRRRALAAALVYVYGLDPRPFGVGRDDLPPAIYAGLNKQSRKPKFAWTTADELRRDLVAA